MGTEREASSIIARVSSQLSAFERRDWELWLIVAVTGIVIGTGLLVLTFPAAFLSRQTMRMEVEVPRELFLALLTLLILFNTYVITRRVELRRTRAAMVSTAIQSELVRLQSFTDPLTEVYNRRSLEDMARKYMSRATRLKKPLTLLLIDADRFKEVNTRFGHMLGDFVIAEIASLLRSVTRGSDAIIRYGGDEFLVILADSEMDGCKVVCTRITTSVDEWNNAGHLNGFALSLSMGLAEWKEGKTLDQVLDAADRAMYVSKQARSERVAEVNKPRAA